MYRSNVRGTNFIQGLARSWRMLFSESKQLMSAYEAAELSLEQAYLDILQDTLSVSLEQTPLFRRMLRALKVFYQKDLIPIPTFSGGIEYALPVEISDKNWGIKDIEYIGNSVVTPSTLLESGVDYRVVPASSIDYNYLLALEPLLDVTQDLLILNSNPFTTTSTFAQRVYTTSLPTLISPIGPSVNYPGLGVDTTHKIVVSFDATGAQYTLPITEVAVSLLSIPAYVLNFIIDDSTTLTSKGITFSVVDAHGYQVLPAVRGRFINNTTTDVAITMWLNNLLVDDYTLSEVYGELLGIAETSTEGYRNLLRGLLQHYVRGQALDRATSAVHVIAGLPVFDSSGEEILSISTSSGIYVQTDKNLYLTDDFYPVKDSVLLATPTLDGNAVDDASRWAVVPSSINLLALGIDSSCKLVVSDGTSPGVSYTADIVKVYNETRLLLSAATPIPGGNADYYGFSIGDNSPSYDNKVSLNTDRRLIIEAFSISLPPNGFKELEVLTDAVKVTDYIATPKWFEGKLVPQQLMRGESIDRKSASPKLYAPKIGTRGVKFGDLMYKIGADAKGVKALGASADLNPIVQLPYFDVSLSALPNAKLFREDEYVYSMSGLGNGYGRVLHHNKTTECLYVVTYSGRFFEGDVLAGQDSNCVATIGYRTTVRIDIPTSTAGLGVSSFSSTDSMTGTAYGKVVAKLGPNHLELYERPSGRQVRVNDVMSIGAVTCNILSVNEEGIAPAHNTPAYFYMENLWKYGILYIKYDKTSFRFPRGLDNLRGAPFSDGTESRLMLYIDPSTSLVEFIEPPEDSLTLNFSRVLYDYVAFFDSNLKINGPSLLHADPWKIGESSAFIIGGTNPAYTVGNVAGYVGEGFTDLAVQLTSFP